MLKDILNDKKLKNELISDIQNLAKNDDIDFKIMVLVRNDEGQSDHRLHIHVGYDYSLDTVPNRDQVFLRMIRVLKKSLKTYLYEKHLIDYINLDTDIVIYGVEFAEKASYVCCSYEQGKVKWWRD